MAAIAKEGRILILTDEDGINRLYRRFLRQRYETICLPTQTPLPEAMVAYDPGCIIIEAHIAAPLVRDVRAQDRAHGTYTGILLITSHPESADHLEALVVGANAFCPKGQVHTLLPSLVQNLMAFRSANDSLSEISARLALAKEELEKLVDIDDLTGLYNMRYINKQLEREFESARRHQTPLSILMIDIDDFKQVNDTNSHLLGSYVIGEVGREVAQVIRKLDLPGRYGGDEFIIVLPHTDAEGSLKVAERLKEKIKQRVYNNGYDMTTITISQGIATFAAKSRSIKDADELILFADAALYQAKDSGRDAIVVYKKPQVIRRKRHA